jgi:hypothetical protein
MKLYHFTSTCHIRAIARHGLTVGDVPTNIRKGKGRVGVWFTSSEGPDGHGLVGSAADKARLRLAVELDPGEPMLVRWVDWAPSNVTESTISALHATGAGFETWFVYFGVLPSSRIIEVTDTQTGAPFPTWPNPPESPFDVPGVPPWQKRMLKQVARAMRVS